MTPLLVKAVVFVAVALTLRVVLGPTLYKLVSLALFAGLALWSFSMNEMATGAVIAAVGLFALRQFIANPN